LPAAREFCAPGPYGRKDLRYDADMSMDMEHREIREAIALIDSAMRKLKLPPEELKRAKNKLVDYLKKKGS
jgi:hypothetical protein